MKAFLFLLLACIFSFTGNVFALSGIAVSDFTCNAKGWYWIDAHFIENYEWKDSIILAVGNGPLKVREPTLNTHGSHCAFFRNNGDGWKLCITRIGGTNKLVKELISIDYGDEMTKGEIYSMLMEWPRGDWIWYSDKAWADRLFRVNVHTAQIQEVVTFPETKIWSLSGNNRWMVTEHCKISLHEVPDADSLLDANAGPVHLNYSCTDWNSGGNRIYNDGCGQTISISGQYIFYNSYNLHENISMVERNPLTNEVTLKTKFNKWSWNEMAVDTNGVFCCSHDATTGECVGHQPVEYLGRQTHTLEEWAVNSEKWNCMTMGWLSMGRYQESGGNICTINWQDSISVNLTQHPCQNDEVNNPEANLYQIWHCDLWLSGPEADIYPGYYEDVLNRDSYTIEGTDIDAIPSLMPMPNRESYSPDMISMSGMDNRIILPHKGNYSMRLYNSRGICVSTFKGLDSEISVLYPSFNTGVHFAVIMLDGVKSVYRFAHLK